MESFLSKHDIIWERTPTRWEEAPFVGNGLTGTMVYWDAEARGLRWLLGRSDVGRLDFPGRARIPNRIQIGTLLQRFAEDVRIDACSIRIDLWNAEVHGTLVTNHGQLEFKLLAPSGSSTFVAEFEASSPELAWTWEPHIKPEGKLEIGHDFTVFEAEDYVPHPRTDVASGGLAVVWAEQECGSGSKRLLCSIGCTPVNRACWNPDDSGQSAREEAVADFRHFSSLCGDEIRAPHREWWHQLYECGFLSLSNTELESIYWTQIYKFASATRPDRPMIDNHGIWSVLPCYAFATWDFNVETTYRLHLTSNLKHFGKPLLHFIDESFNRETMWDEEAGEFRAGIRQQTFLRYRFFDRKTWDHKNLPCDGPGKFLWGMHNYVMHYRHSPDPKMLPKMVLLLEAGINAMLAGMRVEEDGLYHIPFGDSWETWEGRDPVGLFCVLNWALETAAELGPTAGVPAEKVEKWREIRRRTVPYARNEKGLMLGEGQEPMVHRHWTHLMMLYPLDIFDLSDPENARLMRQSIDHWAHLAAGLDGNKPQAGFAPTAAICLYAYLFAETPKADLSVISRLFEIALTGFSEIGVCLWPSTMYREFPGPVMETPFFLSLALQDCILQSRRNGIHVFPAVLPEWPDVVFSKWHAEGDFLVSAKRKDGRTEWITVESCSGGTLKLHTDIDPDTLHINGSRDASGRTLPSGRVLIERDLGRGEVLTISTSAAPDLTVDAVPHSDSHNNPFGLNARFLARRPHYDTEVAAFTAAYQKWFAKLPENRPQQPLPA